ncbi:hypothetical protein ACVWWO_002419 [Bradyrhizobium sp. F1.13.1]
MAKAKKQTTRGRKQDRARVAGGQKYEVGYEAKKTGRSASAVKKAVKKVGSSRKKRWSVSWGADSFALAHRFVASRSRERPVFLRSVFCSSLFECSREPAGLNVH